MIGEAVVEFGKPLKRIELDTPKPEGTAVLVRVHHCGVCHSDVHLQDGYFDIGGGKKLEIRPSMGLPHILGHEIEGEVAALGPDAKGLTIGQRVIVYPWVGCNDCPACNRGDEHYCYKPQQLGVDRPGGFAEYCLLPHPRYLLDYGNAPAALAGSYMCSGLTAFSALKKIGNPGKDDPILIVGAGGLGLMGLEFAKALFAAPVHVADIDPKKREAALKAGAKGAFDPADPNERKRLMTETGGGVHAAIDYAGNESSVNFAMSALRRGGKTVVVGLLGGAFTTPIAMFVFRATGIEGSYLGSLPEALEMMALVKAGKVAPIPLTERPLSRANEALDDLRAGRIVGRSVLKP